MVIIRRELPRTLDAGLSFRPVARGGRGFSFP